METNFIWQGSSKQRRIIHNTSDNANVLKDLFSNLLKFSNNKSVPTDRNAQRNYLQNTNSNYRRFKCSTVTFDQKTLRNSTLKDTGPGYDEFPMFAYKENATSLTSIISHVCNKSTITVGNVTCLLKAGDRKHTGNYRLMTIKPSFSKILEKIVENQLQHYLIPSELLVPKE